MATNPDSPVTVETAAAQALAGHPVGAGETAECFYCHCLLSEGDPCRIYAYRLADEVRFSSAQLACRSCGRDRVTGTLGAHDLLCDAYLAMQSMPAARQHQLVLMNISVLDTSPPADGSRP